MPPPFCEDSIKILMAYLYLLFPDFPSQAPPSLIAEIFTEPMSWHQGTCSVDLGLSGLL